MWLGLRRGAFTSVGWQVTLCDPIRQVTLRSSEMGSLIRSYMRPLTFNKDACFLQVSAVTGEIGTRRTAS